MIKRLINYIDDLTNDDYFLVKFIFGLMGVFLGFLVSKYVFKVI